MRLRALALTSNPTAVPKSICATYTTTSRPQLSYERMPALRQSRHAVSSQLLARRNSAMRRNSTLPTLPNPNPTPTPGSQNPDDVLTWNRFFDLRRKRRYLNLASSAATAATAVMIGGPFMASQDVDTWGAQISGMDPMIVLGMSTIAVAAGGWLCGPSFGGAAFGVWAARRGWNNGIAEVSFL